MAGKSPKNAELVDAVIKNNLDLVKDLIAQGVKIDARSDDGLTALYEAMQSSYQEIALTLIEAGANINAKDKRGETVLMEAIKRKQNRVIQQLLLRGADIHTRSRAGQNTLMVAAAFGTSDVIRQLVELGANIEENDFESLGRAVASSNTETIRTLLELGANPNSCRNSDGETLLMTAVILKRKQAIKILFEHGADVNIVNSDGLNALDLAEEWGFKEIANFLKPYFHSH